MNPATPPPAGYVLIDKPAGITSHDVVDWVRKQTGVRRVGHTGTLDPLATGLLIILVGRQFTKQQASFLKQDKEYLVTAHLGITSDTYDIDGTITSKASFEKIKQISNKQIQQVLPKFRGKISQTVPAYSAVKIKGQKLYQLARNKEKIIPQLPTREITIHHLELLNIETLPPKKVVAISLKVNCSSGTYVRSLVHDLGKKLGIGACVAELRRTKIGQISVDQASQLGTKIKVLPKI